MILYPFCDDDVDKISDNFSKYLWKALDLKVLNLIFVVCSFLLHPLSILALFYIVVEELRALETQV